MIDAIFQIEPKYLKDEAISTTSNSWQILGCSDALIQLGRDLQYDSEKIFLYKTLESYGNNITVMRIFCTFNPLPMDTNSLLKSTEPMYCIKNSIFKDGVNYTTILPKNIVKVLVCSNASPCAIRNLVPINAYMLELISYISAEFKVSKYLDSKMEDLLDTVPLISPADPSVTYDVLASSLETHIVHLLDAGISMQHIDNLTDYLLYGDLADTTSLKYDYLLHYLIDKPYATMKSLAKFTSAKLNVGTPGVYHVINSEIKDSYYDELNIQYGLPSHLLDLIHVFDTICLTDLDATLPLGIRKLNITYMSCHGSPSAMEEQITEAILRASASVVYELNQSHKAATHLRIVKDIHDDVLISLKYDGTEVESYYANTAFLTLGTQNLIERDLLIDP